MLICLWLLFAFPLFLWGSILLGASLYHAGQQNKSPLPSLPRFDMSRRGKSNGETAQARFPDV